MKRTKERVNGQIGGSGLPRRTRTHFRSCGGGEEFNLEKDGNVLFIGAPGYLTANPDA